MMRAFTLILLILSSLESQIVTDSPLFYDELKKGYTESDRPEANFILDIIQNKSASGNDSVVFAATGAGFSMISDTNDPVSDLKWKNSTIGYGGASAIAVDKYSNIWMTTAADTFLTDDGVFLPVGTGVHFSPDSGRTWTSFSQPGITPIQGLTYDIACDPDGGVWMACFGQSLQKLDSLGGEWKTLTCDQKEWDPGKWMNQRMFAVHFTKNSNLWVGTAEGINLCTEYDVPDNEREWRQFTYSDGLSGNFVTAIGSKQNGSGGGEYVYAASWLAESSNEINGISYTLDNGQSWNRALIGEKIYNFGFSGDDVYACGENGLWKSSDNGEYWEKYEIYAWSDRKQDYIKIDRVYSFEYQNDIMFAGTGSGLALSENDGNDWYIAEAYTRSDDSKHQTYSYPNPFSPLKFGEVKLQFSLNNSSGVRFEIYNFAMEKVKSSCGNVSFGPGEHYLTWDGRDDFGKTVDNSVYFYVIYTEEGEFWNKIIVFE